jgi:TonB family protein
MTLRRLSARVAMGLVASLALSVVPAAAQDAITRAKNLYQSADYDEALSVLDQLKIDPASETVPEIAAYRVFCLLALGRSGEADLGIGAILKQDPRYQPSESETSPRIRAVFEDERRRLLPQILQERYERAKASFERKEFQSAADQFKTLLSLIDDPALAGEESRTDFRMVISGFFDLAQAAMGTQTPPPATPSIPPPTVAVAPNPATPAAAVKAQIYSANDTDVVPPVTMSKKMPSWPQGTVELWHGLVGLLEVVVDEQGNVAVASIKRSVHPIFDAKLLQAARDWKFRPASRQGQPVSYRALIEVKVGP